MPSNVIDFTESPQEILAAMINRDNGTTFVASQLDFGTPEVNVGVKNTKITVSAKVGSGFSGSVQVIYDRINLAQVPGVRGTVFTTDGEVAIAHLIPKINAAYQINLSLADIVDAPLPIFSGATPNQTLTFTLMATATCLIYQGSLTLSIRRQNIALGDVITDTVLGDLTFP